MAKIWYLRGEHAQGRARTEMPVQWCMKHLQLILGDDPIPLSQWKDLKCPENEVCCVWVEVNDEDEVEPSERGYYLIAGTQPETVDKLLEGASKFT